MIKSDISLLLLQSCNSALISALFIPTGAAEIQLLPNSTFLGNAIGNNTSLSLLFSQK